MAGQTVITARGCGGEMMGLRIHRNVEEGIWILLLFMQAVIYLSATWTAQVLLRPYESAYTFTMVVSWILAAPAAVVLVSYCLFGRLYEQSRHHLTHLLFWAIGSATVAAGMVFFAWILFPVIIIILASILCIHVWSGYRLFVAGKLGDRR